MTTIDKNTTCADLVANFNTKQLLERYNVERARTGAAPLKSWSESKQKLAERLKTIMSLSLAPTQPTKPPAPKKSATARKVGGRRKFSDAAVITVVQPRNPKRRTGRNPYGVYQTGMTVAQALAKGVKRRDVNYDAWAGHISCAEPTA